MFARFGWYQEARDVGWLLDGNRTSLKKTLDIEF